MHKAYGNLWSQWAAWFTAIAHQRQPLTKWLIVAGLVVAWVVYGLIGWTARDKSLPDALYETIAAPFMAGDYFDEGSQSMELQIARFAGVAVTATGLLFGFSGTLGRAVARLFLMGAAGHVVIAGSGAAPLALARSCRRAKDCVVLIAQDLADETAWMLRTSGVVLIEGDPAHRDVLRAARAPNAAHLVALSDDDAANLQIEASLRAALNGQHGRKITADVAFASPTLLQEAREMRMQIARAEGDKAAPSALEPRPFSLDELAARLLLRRKLGSIMTHAERCVQERVHLLLFGFDCAAEAVAARSLVGLWSARFGPPRLTVVTDDAAKARAVFEGRHPHAVAHEVWKADVEFLELDWRIRGVDQHFLQGVIDRRGAVTFAVVSTGADAQNIVLALGLLRALNVAARSGEAHWRVPIYMKEAAESEFSRQFSHGAFLFEDGAKLEAFGGVEEVATRDNLVGAQLDKGAAIAHEMYVRGVLERGEAPRKEWEAMARDWEDVPETYRSANRAVADHALMKLWDLGWRPAPTPDKRHHKTGQTVPVPTEAEVAVLAKVEHSRWVAERLLAGWRPGADRDNRLMIHPHLVGWDALSDNEKAKDADQVRAAVMLSTLIEPNGFVRRDVAPLA